MEDHLDLCFEAGINVEGINAEVAAGQWEFQVFAKGAKRAGDETWVARYLLERTAERYSLAINWEPKPLGKELDGTVPACTPTSPRMKPCSPRSLRNSARTLNISVYGANNDQRLTGLHETQSIDMFGYGVSDRGASIRIPVGTVEDGWKGRLEDRRTASNADPYKVAAVISRPPRKVWLKPTDPIFTEALLHAQPGLFICALNRTKCRTEFRRFQI